VFPLARMYAGMRTLRLADGPDEVHRRSVARYELGKYSDYDKTNVESSNVSRS
jgi:acyl-CoA dehydrogenase